MLRYSDLLVHILPAYRSSLGAFSLIPFSGKKFLQGLYPSLPEYHVAVVGARAETWFEMEKCSGIPRPRSPLVDHKSTKPTTKPMARSGAGNGVTNVDLFFVVFMNTLMKMIPLVGIPLLRAIQTVRALGIPGRPVNYREIELPELRRLSVLPFNDDHSSLLAYTDS